jgi:hypothetical protein
MAQKGTVYQKSGKGSQALAARDAALTPKLRSMLILVDGKRTVEELAKLAAMLGDPEQLLAQLVQLEMVQPCSSSAASASAPAPLAASSAPAPLAASSAPAPLAGAVTLPEAQRFAVRRLTDLLGPTAEDLCLRIEHTRNAVDFAAAIKKAEAVLRDFKGAEAAAAFAREMLAHRPA